MNIELLEKCISESTAKVFSSEFFISVAGKILRLRFENAQLYEYFSWHMICLKTTANRNDSIFADILISFSHTAKIATNDIPSDKEIVFVDLPQSNIHVRLRNDKFLDGLVIAWDSINKTGHLIIAPSSFEQFSSMSHKLAPLIAMMADDMGVCVLHSAAVGLDAENGLLISGQSGAGKSTLAVACLNFGMYFVSDDTILFDYKNKLAYLISSTCHLGPEMLGQFKNLNISKARQYKGRANKNHIDLSGLSDKIIPCIQIKGIVAPQISPGSESSYERAEKGSVLLPLIMSSAVQFKIPPNSEYSRRAFGYLKDLPVFNMKSGNNMEKNAETVKLILKKIIESEKKDVCD